SFRDAVTNTNHIHKLLPPYSLHLNAAESIFSSAKIHVHKEVIEAEALSGHVANALARITVTMATGRVCEVGRNVELSLIGHRLGALYDTRQALPVDYDDPYVEHTDIVQNPELGSEAVEHTGGEGVEGNVEEEEPLLRLCRRRKYSPSTTRSGKGRTAHD
ncbi:hypothetical protein BGW38_008495, partial [Lunasporangiospora selenospora]